MLHSLHFYGYTDSTMTAASATTALPEPRPSLRERKKLATRRALRRVTLDLVAERGFAHVTVEDIAEAADVSPRTFFNYFPSKEAALFGADPDRTEALRQRLIQELPGESALEALRVVMVGEARALIEEFHELGGDPVEWLRRMKASHVDPHLRAARAAQMAKSESAVAEALAERLGTDPERDPYPMLLAAAGTGVMRAAFSFWGRSGGSVPLDQLVDAAFQALARGLPENCELRGIAETTTGAGASAGLPAARTHDRRKDHH
jgi:AcrR family transcriptional regulator